MEKRLVQAKKVIADLKAEVNVLQSARADGQQGENQGVTRIPVQQGAWCSISSIQMSKEHRERFRAIAKPKE